MPTPHNQANVEEIASKVLMPGDPLRAKYIAEHFLENAKLVNQVRNMLAYTGTYKGQPVTVMASGMGMPSIGIYSYELYANYGVEQIIRIGSTGSYVPELKLRNVVLAESVWSQSSYARVQNGYDKEIILPSQELNDKILKAAERVQIPLVLTRVHSSDVFYKESHMESFREIHARTGCTCVEMESFALFHNANVLGKKAACLLTVSDSLCTQEITTAEERQNTFTDMMKVALEACLEK